MSDALIRSLEVRVAGGDILAEPKLVHAHLRRGTATLPWLAENPWAVHHLPLPLRQALQGAFFRAPLHPGDVPVSVLDPELRAQRDPRAAVPTQRHYEGARHAWRLLPYRVRVGVSYAALMGGGVRMLGAEGAADVVQEGSELWIQPLDYNEIDPEAPPYDGEFPIKIHPRDGGGFRLQVEGYEDIVVPGRPQ